MLQVMSALHVINARPAIRSQILMCVLAVDVVGHLQKGVQNIWEGAFHKESVLLQHQLDFAVVACAGMNKLPDLWRQSHLH